VRYVFFVALLTTLAILSGCQSDPPKITFTDIDMSVADAGSGEKLFLQSNNGAPICATCHGVGGEGGIGPSLKGIVDKAGSRVSGQNAEEYLFWSIINPSRYLVAGYSNVMYAKFADVFVAEDIADLIAYLLTLK
jgi:cytochrome c2